MKNVKEVIRIAVRNEKLYHVYHGIKQRCYNKNNPRYNIYGGKCITMCTEWLADYLTFKDWSIKNGYVEDERLSIDRINPEDNYNPENCRWISLSENSGRANLGRQKNKSHNGKMFAINPFGVTEEITKFKSIFGKPQIERKN